MKRYVCKLCGGEKDETEFYVCKARRGKPEYCKACNSKSVVRKRWAKTVRKDPLGFTLQIQLLKARLQEMEMVQTRINEGLHPVNW